VATFTTGSLGHASRLLMALFAQMANVEYDCAPTMVVISLTLRAACTVTGIGRSHGFKSSSCLSPFLSSRAISLWACLRMVGVCKQKFPVTPSWWTR